MAVVLIMLAAMFPALVVLEAAGLVLYLELAELALPTQVVAAAVAATALQLQALAALALSSFVMLTPMMQLLPPQGRQLLQLLVAIVFINGRALVASRSKEQSNDYHS